MSLLSHLIARGISDSIYKRVDPKGYEIVRKRRQKEASKVFNWMISFVVIIIFALLIIVGNPIAISIFHWIIKIVIFGFIGLVVFGMIGEQFDKYSKKKSNSRRKKSSLK